MNTRTPLNTLIKIDKESRNFGLYWNNYEEILNQIKSEYQEVTEALILYPEHTEEEIGDLFHSLISLCVFLDLNVDKIILQAIKKYNDRMSILEDILRTKFNLTNLHNKSTAFRTRAWKMAKKKHSLVNKI